MVIRPFTQSDILSGWKLSQQAGWSHSLADWQFLARFAKGVVAQVEGQRVGCALYWLWGEQRATLGMVLVDANFQGQGIGQQLVQAALNQCGDRYIQLCATQQGKGLYRKLGFVETGQLLQCQATAINAVSEATHLTEYNQINPANYNDLPQLLELEQQATSLYRPELLNYVIQHHEVYTLTDQHGRLNGFSCIKPFGAGMMLGPIIASSVSEAKVLLQSILYHLQGQAVRIDTPCYTYLQTILDKAGLQPVGNATLMQYPAATQAMPGTIQQFSVMNQALG